MKIKKGTETLTVKDVAADKACLPEWIDENGKRWGGPTLAWMLNQGFEIVPPDPVIPPTEEEVKAAKIQAATFAVQVHLDAMAASLGYDNINTIAKYIGFDNPFQGECLALATWCANCWGYCFSVLAEVDAGTRTEPTTDELIAELPTYNG